MKCPHCNKEINMNDTSRLKKEEVYKEICKSKYSITSLSKKLDMKRSSLRYYINELLKEGRITKNRFLNSPGRPAILKPNKNEK
jgi:predicted transcriptional regulator